MGDEIYGSPSIIEAAARLDISRRGTTEGPSPPHIANQKKKARAAAGLDVTGKQAFFARLENMRASRADQGTVSTRNSFYEEQFLERTTSRDEKKRTRMHAAHALTALAA